MRTDNKTRLKSELQSKKRRKETSHTGQRNPLPSVKPFASRKNPSNYKKIDMANPTPRESSVATYARWIKYPGKIEEYAVQVLESVSWQPRDRGLFMEILYGTIRWRHRIEWIIGQLSQGDTKRHPYTRAAVSIGIYQLLFLDRVPDYAVVDSSVKMTRHYGQIEAGWVNALLRRLCREREHWKEAYPSELNPDEALSIRYSFPRWMIEKWLKVMPKEILVEFLQWNNRRPEIILRFNPLKVNSKQAQELLDNLKIRWTQSQLDAMFFTVGHSGDQHALKPVLQGFAAVQDHSQGLVARIVNPKPGERILDLCAAPGGKSTHLAELCTDCDITATDKNAERLDKLADIAKKSGYSNVNVLPYQDVLNDKGRFDAILVDAPCTGTGVLARRPDLRWRLKPGESSRMAAVQDQLLRYAADRVNPGGRIIYSTCSIEQAENDQVVDRFLEDHRNFREVSLRGLITDTLVNEKNRLGILGPEISGDGVFAAKLERYK